MINQARALFKNYQLDDCVVLCRQLLSQHDDDNSAQVLLSAVLLLRANSSLEQIEAKGILEEIKQQNELDLDAATRADLAAAYLLSGQSQIAEQCLRSTLDQAPHTPEIDALLWARLAMVMMRHGSYQEGFQACQNSLQIVANVPVVQMNQARLLARLGQIEAAQDFIQSLSLPQSDSHPALLEGWIEVLFLAKKNDQAQQLVDDLLAEVTDKIATIDDESSKNVQQTQRYYFRLLNIRSSFAIAEEQYADAELYVRQGLALKDDDQVLVRALADLCDLQGRFSESTSLFLKLSRRYPNEPSLFLGLANAYIQLQQMDNALMAVERAEDAAKPLKQKPLDAQILSMRARIEQDKAPEEAIKNYILALEYDPDCWGARQGLGHLYLLLGRSDEAIEQFNLVSEHSLVAGFSSLVSVREFPKDEQVLEQLERTAVQPIWSGASGIQAQIRTLFSLASAREAKKDYTAAFNWALEANRKTKHNLSWNNDTTQNLTQRLVNTFTADFYQQRPNFGSHSRLPIFVLGMPRSGTTLMEQMLGNHSAVLAAGELGLVSSRVHSLTRWEQHIGSGSAYPECVASLSPSDVLAMAEQHIEGLHNLSHDDVDHIIDKLPHNFQHIGLIHLLFPHAKIIYCRRNAKAIALSNFFTHYQAAHQGMGFAYDLTDLGEHIAAHQALMTHWQNVLPNSIYSIDYEDIVDDAEHHMHHIIKWLNLPWEDAVLKHTQLERPVKTASVWQVRQKVYSSSKEKWQHYAEQLKPFDLALKNAQARWSNWFQSKHNVALNPENAGDLNKQFSLVFSAAIAHHHHGELQQAEAGYRQVLQHNNTHKGATYLLAGIAYQAGQFEPALNLYQRVAKHYRHLSAFHFNMGLTLFALKDYSKAKLAFEQAIKLKKDYTEAQAMLDELLQLTT